MYIVSIKIGLSGVSKSGQADIFRHDVLDRHLNNPS